MASQFQLLAISLMLQCMQIKKSPIHADGQSVVVLGTGGTVAGIAPDATRPYAYSDSQIGIEALISALPVKSNLRIECEQPFQMGSEDFTEETWRSLHARISHHLGRADVCGVVLAQGTDTIEETAYFLNLTLDSSKPVIVTGAMRPSGTLSSDANLNLFQSVSLAAHPSAGYLGTLVLLNERIHAARYAVKTHTFAADALASPGWGPLGLMLGGVPNWAWRPVWLSKNKLPLHGDLLAQPMPRVDLVWSYAGVPRDVVDCAVAAGARGIVYAGTGNGSVAAAVKPALQAAAKRGCMVVRATRTICGPVVRNAAENDDELCTIAAGNISAVKARILLQVGLACGLSRASLQTLFDQEGNEVG